MGPAQRSGNMAVLRCLMISIACLALAPMGALSVASPPPAQKSPPPRPPLSPPPALKSPPPRPLASPPPALKSPPPAVLSGGGTMLPNSIDQAVNDMDASTKHEGCLHGVPLTYAWATNPVPKMGFDFTKYTVITPWGQTYEQCALNPASNTRVQLGRQRAYLYSKSQKKWILIQYATQIGGLAYPEAFNGGKGKNGDATRLSDGTLAVKAGTKAGQPGYNFHNWGRCFRSPCEMYIADTIPVSDVGGVYMNLAARLIVDDTSKPSDIASARYLLCIGVDFRKDVDAAAINSGISRCKWVTQDWRPWNAFSFYTGVAGFRATPPPMTYFP